MTAEQNIAQIFESGQYELAFTLAESQGIDIVNLPVDFNNFMESDELTNMKWSILKFPNGLQICIAAGTAFKSFKPTASDKYMTFEVIVTGEEIDSSVVNNLPNKSWMFSNHDFSDELGFQIVYGNLTTLKILELIKSLLNITHTHAEI
jgi:hypothetical protein